MKRLFFALWPDDETRDKVAALSKAIKTGGLKKVNTGNIHVTLVFLGNIDEAQETAIRLGADEITSPPFQIDFDRLTVWRRAGILCLTASEQIQSLMDLVEALKVVARTNDVEVETRSYRAHVTLARKAWRKPEIETETLSWRADSFALVESVSGNEGIQYRVLQSWPLTTEKAVSGSSYSV